MTMITKRQTFRSVTALPNETGLPRLKITTDDLDRDRDRVIPSGLDAAAWLKNPAVCWGHQHSEIPIGTGVRLDQADNGIDLTFRWLEHDPFADRVKNAWEQGVVRAASIGFLPLESQPNGLGGRDFTRWELTEVSLVAIPANRSAVKTLKALGLYEEADEAVLEIVPSPSYAIAQEVGRLAEENLRRRLGKAARFSVPDDTVLEILDTYDVDEQALAIGVAATCVGLIASEAADQARKHINYLRGRVE